MVLCAASCQHGGTPLPDDSAIVTGKITSFSALTRQKGETRMALRLTNAVVVSGECDLSAHALPTHYGNQHRFVVEWSKTFQVAGEKGVQVRGHACTIILQSNTVVKVTGDWEKD